MCCCGLRKKWGKREEKKKVGDKIDRRCEREIGIGKGGFYKERK